VSTVAQRQAWVLEVLPTIAELAKRFSNRWRSVSVDEFRSEAQAAAVRGAERYSADGARSFEAFIYKRLVGAMVDLARARIGQAVREELLAMQTELRDGEPEGDEEADEIVVDPNAPSAWDGAVLVAKRKATMLAAASSASTEEAWLSAIEYRETQARFRAAGRALENPKQRRLYTLFYEEERTLDEVAKDLGVSLRHASRIHDAVKDALIGAVLRSSR